MSEIPQKQFYKVNEVCSYTDTQPYILRFWESEFPQLAPDKSRGGQSVYSRQDLDLVLRIKRLLYEEEYTIDGARKELEREQKPSGRGRTRSEPRRIEAVADGEPELPEQVEAVDADEPEIGQPALFAPPAEGVPRERYEGAVEEIGHLRLKLKEAESRSRKAELAVQSAEQVVAGYHERAERVAQRLDELLKRLDASSS